jgi:hypothetical protein
VRGVLELAASLARGIPVDLRDTVTGLGHANISRLLTAIRHAPGRRDDANLWSPPRHDGPDALFHCGVVTQGSEAPRRWGPGPRSSPEAEA